jgi:hypothetical protein
MNCNQNKKTCASVSLSLTHSQVIVVKEELFNKEIVLSHLAGRRQFVTFFFFFFFRYTVLLQDVEDYVLLHAWVFTKIFT